MRNLILLFTMLVSGFVSAQTFNFKCLTAEEVATNEFADFIVNGASAGTMQWSVGDDTFTFTRIATVGTEHFLLLQHKAYGFVFNNGAFTAASYYSPSNGQLVFRGDNDVLVGDLFATLNTIVASDASLSDDNLAEADKVVGIISDLKDGGNLYLNEGWSYFGIDDVDIGIDTVVYTNGEYHLVFEVESDDCLRRVFLHEIQDVTDRYSPNEAIGDSYTRTSCDDTVSEIEAAIIKAIGAI